MRAIGWRALSALIYTVILALLFWLVPHMELAMLGATTPDRISGIFVCIFMLLWVYLVVQGYPVSHGDIGSASVHNLDNIISGFPAIVAMFGFFVHFAGFHPLSFLNLMLATMTIAVVVYDMWILGGAAAKINRLTDEYKAER